MTNDDRIDEVVSEMASDYNAPPPVPRDIMWERIQAARKVTPIRANRIVPAWTAWGLGLAAMLLIGVGIGRLTRVDSSTRGPVATAPAPAPVPAPVSGQGADSTPSAAPATQLPGAASAAAVAANEPRPAASRPGPADGDRKTSAPTREYRLASAPAGFRSSNETSPGAARSGWRGDRPANSAAAALPYRLAAVQHLTRAEALLTSYEAEARAGRQDDQMQAWSRDLLSTTRLLMDSPAGRDPKLRPLLEDLELVLAQIQQATTGVTSDRDIVVEGMQKRGVLPRLRTAIPAGPSAGI